MSLEISKEYLSTFNRQIQTQHYNELRLVFYRLLLWKLKKQEEMLSDTRVIEELEKIRVVLVKRGDKEPRFMFETMGLDQMRLFTALGLETVLKDS